MTRVESYLKNPVVLLLFVQLHRGPALGPALGGGLGREAKLQPLQVEAEPGADGFDETLLQGL